MYPGSSITTCVLVHVHSEVEEMRIRPGDFGIPSSAVVIDILASLAITNLES